MSNAIENTLDQALDWFGLDAGSVTEQQVKDAFKILAKKFHPDASGNYKGKLDNYENFIAAVDAKDILITALDSSLLPYDIGENETPKHNYGDPVFDQGMNDQDRFNYATTRPLEYLLELPLLGPLLNVIVVAAYVLGLVGFSILLLPLWTLYIISTFIPDKKIGHIRRKIGDYATGPFMYVAYYLTVFVCVEFLVVGDAAWLYPYVLGAGWFMVTLLALDEFYCMFRYWFVAKKIRQDVLKLG